MAKDRRKAEKKKRRDLKKQKAEQLYQARKTERALYPRIVIDPRDGSLELVCMVSRLAKETDFTDSLLFNRHDQTFLKLIHAAGIDSLPDIIEKACRENGEPFSIDYLFSDVWDLTCRVGQHIFSRLPTEIRNSPLPQGFFQVLPRGRDIHISFGFAPTIGDATNPIYCPCDEPLLLYGPTKWRVGFYRHAVEQLCNRIRAHDTVQYTDLVRCFLYFTNCRYFECVHLADGQPAIRLYCPVGDRGTSCYDAYMSLLPEQACAGPFLGKPCYVLGYCPFDEQITKGRVVAKTFLFPGYKNTPEDQAVKAAAITADERRKLLAAASHNATYRVLFEGNTDVIRWYHENGVPQVKYISEDIIETIKIF